MDLVIKRHATSAWSRVRVRAMGVTAAVLIVTLAGCGDDDDGAGGSATTSQATPTSEATSTTAATTTTENAAPAGAVVIAHRGASGYAPEHTFAAYDLALEQGADYIEQDLQMTADGVLVVLHDDTLDRTARGPADSCTGPVSAKTLTQLQQCDVGSWFNEAHPDLADPAFVDLRIPTMEEVLDRYGPDVRYYIEIKDPAAQPGVEEALLDLLDQAGLGDDADDARPVLIQSFSSESLQHVHSLRPELPLVQLLLTSASALDEAILDDIPEYAVAIGPASVNVDQALVDAAHARCLDVHPYTIDDPAEMTSLLAAGVDGMFTNMPDVLLAQRDSQPAPGNHCAPPG